MTSRNHSPKVLEQDVPLDKEEPALSSGCGDEFFDGDGTGDGHGAGHGHGLDYDYGAVDGISGEPR
jgi:hypothetical protein